MFHNILHILYRIFKGDPFYFSFYPLTISNCCFCHGYLYVGWHYEIYLIITIYFVGSFNNWELRIQFCVLGDDIIYNSIHHYWFSKYMNKIGSVHVTWRNTCGTIFTKHVTLKRMMKTLPTWQCIIFIIVLHMSLPTTWNTLGSSQCPIFLSDFNQIWIFLAEFHKSQEYQIPQKCVQQ